MKLGSEASLSDEAILEALGEAVLNEQPTSMDEIARGLRGIITRALELDGLIIIKEERQRG
jgi:hypothetical protein